MVRVKETPITSVELLLDSSMVRLGYLAVLTAVAQAPVAAFGMSKAGSSPVSSVGSNMMLLRSNKGVPMSSSASRIHTRQHTVGASSKTALSLSGLNFVPRGGAIAPVIDAAKNWNASPSSLFNTSLGALAVATFFFKVIQKATSSDDGSSDAKKPKSVKDLQIKFLSVFWLLRCADWLQGPYFYEVYASKVFNGVPASLALVSQLFLTGFASTALFGPLVGKALDQYGRKKGTLAFSVIYALGAFSTKSPLLQVLFLGRILSGIGTSLLFSAPEAWLVGESQKSGDDPDGSYLGETFGLVSCTKYCVPSRWIYYRIRLLEDLILSIFGLRHMPGIRSLRFWLVNSLQSQLRSEDRLVHLNCRQDFWLLEDS